MTQNLKDKMLNYQVPPPEGLWQSIAFKLDEEDNANVVAQKLNKYEIVPPSFVWDNIVTELDKEDKVITLQPKAKVFSLRKAAIAASAVLFLATTVWYFTQKQNNTPEVANDNKNLPTTENTSIASVTPNSTVTNSNSLPTSDTQEKNTSKTANNVATKQKPKVNINNDIVTNATVTDLAKNPFENKTEKIKTSTGDTPENIDLITTPNTYLSIVGPNGQSIKVSSKFSKQLGLFTESDPNKMENIDFIIKESAAWRSKIADWRKKMNTVDVSPSLNNFMDILELSKKINNEKKK